MKFILLCVLSMFVAAANAATQTLTLTWDLYKDTTVGTYNASDYEIQVLCRKNSATLANVKKVPATTTATDITADLSGGDTFGCVIKAHRLSDNQWGAPTAEVSVTMPSSTPSTPTGLKAVIKAIIGFIKSLFGWLS